MHRPRPIKDESHFPRLEVCKGQLKLCHHSLESRCGMPNWRTGGVKEAPHLSKTQPRTTDKGALHLVLQGRHHSAVIPHRVWKTTAARADLCMCGTPPQSGLHPGCVEEKYMKHNKVQRNRWKIKLLNRLKKPSTLVMTQAPRCFLLDAVSMFSLV